MRPGLTLGRLTSWFVCALVVIGLTGVAVAAPPVVKTVPWVASNSLIPHDTYAGKAIRLKGTSDIQGATIQYTWDFGDGSPVATGTVSNMHAIEASHTYAGSVGTVWTATLTVTNTGTGESASQQYYVKMENKTLDVEANVAIDEGLWYLHKTMARTATDGYWVQSYWTETPASLNAFFVNGHKETGASSNPYTETVQRGMRRLFTLLYATPIGNQTYPAPIGTVNPDGNGNGLGIYSAETYTYSGGVFIDAIVASGSPDAIAPTGGANVIGRKYRDIVQDMIDGYAYGQTDSGTWMGGWGYTWNSGNSDNSVNQWAAIGFLAGDAIIGSGPNKWAPTPAFVKTANKNSLSNTQATTANCGAAYDGAFAYTNNYCYFPWGPYGTTPAGMVQMVLDDMGRGDAQWDRTENFTRTNFCNAGNSTQSIRSYYYGLFSFTKAMLLYRPGGVSTPLQYLANQPGGANPIDWYAAEASKGDQCDGVARTLVTDQLADGRWGLHNIYGYHTGFSSAWAIIMLNRTVFESGVPVAVASATPNPAVAGQVITLSGAGSFHQDASKNIISWAWDLNNEGTFETTGVTTTVSFGALGNYPVKLKVCDDGVPPSCAETTLTLLVTIPPLAPTAEAGGPYGFCLAPAGTPQPAFFLTGAGSVNPDDGAHEAGAPGDFIKAYEWSLANVPFATGVQPDVTTYFVGKGVGSYLISLKVTDNTALSFPSSRMGDLSDTDSAQVVVRGATDPACAGCVKNLAARAKPGEVQLTWTHLAGTHHYNVYRGTISGGPYLKIASTTSTFSTYLDRTVVNGTTYYYVVRPAAINDAEFCQSNQASARPVAR